MRIDIQTKIEEYAFLMDKIRDRFGDDPEAMVVLQEIGKDIRASNIQQKKSYNSNSPATEKQVAYLKRLGSTIPEGLTKYQASMLIDQNKNQSEETGEKVFEVPVRVP